MALRDGSTLRWLLTDHLGGTSVTVTGTAETGELRYHPFGATRYTSGTTPTSQRYTGQREEGALGLYFYGARWYDPALGRFVQPDTLVPQPGDAADWDRFAYVRNNPLKLVDPDGHCPTPPESMGRTLCIALFIAPDSIYAGPLEVHGDGRSFDNDSHPAASRGYAWISLDQDETVTHMNPSGYYLPVLTYAGNQTTPRVGSTPALAVNEELVWFPPSDKNTWAVSRDEHGAIIVSYDLVISGPLDWTGAAPHINGIIRMAPDGQGNWNYSFTRDGFPWAEAYYHDGKGGVQTVFQDPAVRGNPHDLFGIEPNPSWAADYIKRNQSLRFGPPRISQGVSIDYE